LKRIYKSIHLPLFLLALLGVQFAHAQASLDVHMGISGASDKSNGLAIDTFGDGTLYNTPALNGVFLNFGAGAMLTPRFGFGGEFSLKPGKADYAGLQYRPIFYDFNGIVHPLTSSKRIVPEIQAGLGGMNMKFYYNQQNCNAFAGCSSSSTYVQSANHFQLHTGVGVSFFLTSKIYVRPQFDLHWVNNFSQFNSNFVPQYGVAVGYRFGDN
jgi:hypothetical protein